MPKMFTGPMVASVLMVPLRMLILLRLIWSDRIMGRSMNTRKPMMKGRMKR